MLICQGKYARNMNKILHILAYAWKNLLAFIHIL
jgi:hypothetical protein